jgi:hypothetical protein
MLLTGALGAVFIILTLYADIFAFERKAYVIQWFAGWMIIAFNYVLDAFFPDLLRGNRLMFLFSVASWFFANFLIFYGNCSFLGIKIHKPLFVGASAVWLMGFFGLSRIWPAVALIAYANAAVFFLTLVNGVWMIRLGKKPWRACVLFGDCQHRLGLRRDPVFVCLEGRSDRLLRRHARHALCHRHRADPDVLRPAQVQDGPVASVHPAPVGARRADGAVQQKFL